MLPLLILVFAIAVGTIIPGTLLQNKKARNGRLKPLGRVLMVMAEVIAEGLLVQSVVTWTLSIAGFAEVTTPSCRVRPMASCKRWPDARCGSNSCLNSPLLFPM